MAIEPVNYIRLPGIKAVSRNDTTGHWIKYKEQLNKAQKWMATYGKRVEFHYQSQVDIIIDAFYNMKSKHGGPSQRNHLVDSSNIDDKIFIDTLIRYRTFRIGGRNVRSENSVWFVEDDDPQHIRYVVKRAWTADFYSVVIGIIPIEVSPITGLDLLHIK